jgi:3',5'-cyclic AMP phosphodiesterase CpdA
VELSTVADDEVIFHDGAHVHRVTDLMPDTDIQLDGVVVRTLTRPPGERLATIATVNDVHFGEVECGVIEGMELGPILQSEPGEDPYPEIMNAAAVEEISAIEPDAVVAKGDLTATGSAAEYQRFLDRYATAFGDRLLHVRGNHDAYHGPMPGYAAPAVQDLRLPGVIVAVLDTVVPGYSGGQVTAAQLDWLDTLGADADRPVLVFGHHHAWKPGSANRPDHYFGIRPDDSERLVDVVARRPALIGYFAGHTHRNRVRRFTETGETPWVEVACVKDYPGSWAEYRVFEGGVLQIHRRLSTGPALAWSERCRQLYGGLYPVYALGEISDRCFPIWPRSASFPTTCG